MFATIWHRAAAARGAANVTCIHQKTGEAA